MPVKLERSFRADSPIGTYWLGHCTGFRVKGFRRSGTVEEVELAVDGRVDALAVRRRGFVRTRLILVPAHAIATVDPWEEMVVLSRGRSNGRPRRYVPPARAVVAADSLAQRPRRRLGRRSEAEAPPVPVVPPRRPAPPVREPEPVEDVVWIEPPAEAVSVEPAPAVEETVVPDVVEEPEPVAVEEVPPEPEPLEEVVPVAVEELEPEPVAEVAPEPAEEPEPEPVVQAEPEVEGEPLVVALEAALLAIDEANSAEPEPEPVEPEEVAAPEPEPLVVAEAPEPEPLAAPVPLPPLPEPEEEPAVGDGELVVAAWGISEAANDPWESTFAAADTVLDLPPVVAPAPDPVPRREPTPAPAQAPRTRSPFRRANLPVAPPEPPAEPKQPSPSVRERLAPVALATAAAARRAGAGVGAGARRAGTGVGVGARRAGTGVGVGATKVAARGKTAAAAMPSHVEKGRERVHPAGHAAAVLGARVGRALGIVALLTLELAARGTQFAAASIYRLALATRALAVAVAEGARRRGPGLGRSAATTAAGAVAWSTRLLAGLARAGQAALVALWRMVPRRGPGAYWRERKGWVESRPEPVNAQRRPRRTDDLPPGVRLRNPAEQALGTRLPREDTRH